MKKVVVRTISTLFLVFMLSMPALASSSFGIDSFGGDLPRDAPKEKFEVSTASPQQLGSSSSGTEFTPSTDADPWVKFRENEGWDLDQYLFKESSPIDFYIDVDDFKPDPTISPKPKLTLRVWDVDYVAPVHPPERDLVKINGKPLGYLTGANEQWSTVTFDVAPSFIVEGSNHIQVFIDVLGDDWAVEVDWAELKIPFNIKVTKIEVVDGTDIEIKKGDTDHIITGSIWEKKFDGKGKLVDVPGISGDTKRDYPIAVWFKNNHKFKVKISINTWPKQWKTSLKWKPKIGVGWVIWIYRPWIMDDFDFHGWEKEFDVTPPPRVGTYLLRFWTFRFSRDDMFIASPQFTNHKLYVTFGEPQRNLEVREYTLPPKEEWIKTSCDWAMGAQGEKADEQVIAKITKSINDNPYNWVYKAIRREPMVKGVDLVERKKSYGSCGSFREVLQLLSGVQGVVGKRKRIVNTIRGLRFLTVPLKALDNNEGNAYIDGGNWADRDRWVFGDHSVVEYKKKCYDPTFKDRIGIKVDEIIEKYVYAWGQTVERGPPPYIDCKRGTNKAKLYRGTARTAEQRRWGIWKYKLNPGEMFTQIRSTSTVAGFAGNFSDYGLDVDGDGLYNFLIVEAWVNITEAGNYCMLGTLSSNQSFMSLKTEDVYLDTGLQATELYFIGSHIYDGKIDGNYSVDLILLDENGIEIDSGSFNTSYYNHIEFQGLHLELINLTDYGTDVDSDGLYDYLSVELSLDVIRANNYSIAGTLCSNETYITSAYNYTFLSSGTEIIYLNFDGLSIRRLRINGSYTLNIMLSDGIYGKTETKNTSIYFYTQFEKPSGEFVGPFSDYTVDVDSDGLFDFLSLNVGTNVSIAANYTVLGYLFDYTGKSITVASNSTYLGTGISNVVLNFDGTMIYRNGIDGPYTLRFLQLFDVNGSLIDGMDKIYNTTAYSYTIFQRPKASFTGSYSDYGVDSDGDGLFNFLTIQVELNVTKAGNYTMEGALYDTNGSLIAWATYESYFNIGTQSPALNFNGITIYSGGVNGPYNLKDLRLSDEIGSIVDVRYDAYNTSAYNYTDFQRPAIALTGVFSDFGRDTDADGFYDYLVVEIGVMVAYSGTYDVNARLKDVNGNEIVWASSSSYLNKDIPQTIQLNFDGRYIFGNGVNGPYYVKDLSIYYSNIALYVLDVYTTSTYNYTGFQKSGTIMGTVTDINAVPVVGALVYVSGVDYEYTNINGSYKLNILQSGTYTVEVIPPPELHLLGNSTAIDVTIGEITILNFMLHPKFITATIYIDPATLNLKSKGKWITSYIELPENYTVSDIDILTVKLNGEIQAELHPTEVGDHDDDGIPDLMVKFDRQDVIALLSAGEATLTVTGEVNEISFEGSDTIKVIVPMRGPYFPI